MYILILSVISGVILSLITFTYLKVITTSFLKSFDINALLNEINLSILFKETKPLIDKKLDIFFKTQLPKKLPIVSMFVGDKTTKQLKEVFIEELDAIFPEMMQSFLHFDNLNLKIAEILNKQIKQLSIKFILFSFLLGCLWGGIIATLTSQMIR